MSVHQSGCAFVERRLQCITIALTLRNLSGPFASKYAATENTDLSVRIDLRWSDPHEEARPSLTNRSFTLALQTSGPAQHTAVAKTAFTSAPRKTLPDFSLSASRLTRCSAQDPWTGAFSIPEATRAAHHLLPLSKSAQLDWTDLMCIWWVLLKFGQTHFCQGINSGLQSWRNILDYELENGWRHQGDEAGGGWHEPTAVMVCSIIDVVCDT